MYSAIILIVCQELLDIFTFRWWFVVRRDVKEYSAIVICSTIQVNHWQAPTPLRRCIRGEGCVPRLVEIRVSA